MDFAKNRPLTPLTFTFEYNASLSDEIPPEVVDDDESPLVTLSSGRGIKLTVSDETLVDLEEDEGVESIQVSVSDAGSGINLSASSMQLLTSPGEALVPAEKRETPINRFLGKLILRKIAIPFDGTYALRIQPVDNAGNDGDAIDYLFRYKTVDDTQPPQVDIGTLTFTRTPGVGDTDTTGSTDEKPIPLTDGILITTPISSLSIDATDAPPSVGFNLNPAVSTIQLINASGETVPGELSYSNPVTTLDGTVLVKLQLQLDTPLTTNGSDDSDYTVSVKVEDNSGNMLGPQIVSFKYDTIAPDVFAITQPNIDVQGTPPLLSGLPTTIEALLEDTFIGSGIAPPLLTGEGSVLHVLAPNGSRVPGRSPTRSEQRETMTALIFEPDPIATTDGIYTIIVTPEDQAGNIGTQVAGKFRLDTSPPDVIGMRVGNQQLTIDTRQLIIVNPFVAGEVSEIQLTLTDANGIDIRHPATTFELLPPPESITLGRRLEGALIETGNPATPLLFRLTVPLSINGVYTIRGNVADSAGNLRNLEIVLPRLRFTYDNRSPDIGEIVAVDAGTGVLVPLADGALVPQLFDAVEVAITDATTGIAWAQTKIVLKDET